MSFPAYPEYKDSGVEWLGEVPAHWRALRFKEIFRERSEKTDDGRGELLSVSAYTGVRPRSELVEDSEYLSRAASLEGYKKCQHSDLIMNIMLAWNRGLWFAWQDGIVSPSYSVFSLVGNSNPRFMNYLVRSNEYITYFWAFSSGVIESRLRLYPEVFGRLSCVLPPVDEQSVIAEFLDHETARIDALIEEQQRLIELLQEKRQAVISHAVTKGLDPDVPMKDSGVEWLGEVPAHWAVHRMKYVSPEITVGIVVEPSKYYVDEGVPALRSINVRAGGVSRENLVYISPESNDLHSKSKIYAGDLVVVRSGQPGTTGVVPEDLGGCNCIDLIIIRKPDRGSEWFLSWYLGSDSAIRQFSEGSGGAIQQHFNIGTAANLLIAWPPLEEQLQIVQFIEREARRVDTLIDEAERAMALLAERRSALISATVTGKIDVRGWSAGAGVESEEPDLSVVAEELTGYSVQGGSA